MILVDTGAHYRHHLVRTPNDTLPEDERQTLDLNILEALKCN